MLRAAKSDPSSRIAECFARVLSKPLGELALAPLTRPAQLAARSPPEFPLQKLFPGSAPWIPDPDPNEVEEFVGENPRAVRRTVSQAGIQVDFTAAKVGASHGSPPAIIQPGGPEDVNRVTGWG
jgi:hypothetical protein